MVAAVVMAVVEAGVFTAEAAVVAASTAAVVVLIAVGDLTVMKAALAAQVPMEVARAEVTRDAAAPA